MRRTNIIAGLILLFVGLLVLLENLGYLQFLGVSVWRIFWPVAFIALGIWILLGSRNHGRAEAETLSLPLEGANAADVRLDYGAGELRVVGASAPGMLIEGTFEEGVEHEARQREGRAFLRLKSPSVWGVPWSWSPATHRHWHVQLNPDIPLNLAVHTGASDCSLNLAHLKVTRLRIESGASAISVTLPENAGHTDVQIETGAASVSVRIPDGVAARIQARGALSSTTIDRSRFPRHGEVYRSEDYDTAPNRADIRVETGVGSVSIM